MSEFRKRLVIGLALFLLVVALFNFYVLYQSATVDITGRASGSLGFCLNYYPVMAEIPNQTAYVDVLYNFTVNASDFGGGAVFYFDDTSLFNISNSTGLINFTPTVGDIGIYFINITVIDNSTCRKLRASKLMILSIESISTVARPSLEGWLKSNNEDTILNWTNVTAAESYTIYYSNNLSAILNLNVSNIPDVVKNSSGITDLNYTDILAKSNISKYYRVAAVRQGAKNLSLETVGKLDIPLVPGFNLVSTPFDLKFDNLSGYDPARTRPANAIDTIYDDGFDKVDRIASQWWPAKGSSLELIEGGKGYFAYANRKANLTFVGLVLNTFNVSLSSGFNLVGWYGAFEDVLGNITISNPINTTTSGCVDTIYEYDNEKNTFEKTDYVVGYGYWSASKSNVSTIQPGKGYWFNTKTNCDWVG